jgi:signal transduction histidine kinase
MLDMFMYPVFCVKDGIVTSANHAAADLQIAAGMQVDSLLVTGHEEYSSYVSGCLSVSVRANQSTYLAMIIRSEAYDYFHLHTDVLSPDMRALALTAQQMRGPLANAIAITDRLFPEVRLRNDSAAAGQVGQINRSLYQLLRTVRNMSDISRFSKENACNMEYRDIAGILNEAFENAAQLTSQVNRELLFTGLEQPVWGVADEFMLKNAVEQLISNAVKFSPEGSKIRAGLAQRGKLLILTVQDEGEGIRPELYSSVFFRYLRDPGIEDGRHGAGLGLPIVQAVATAHGGTLLLDSPGKVGARFTLTIALRSKTDYVLREPSVKVITGGLDDSLVGLSDVLPADLYQNIN